jgi:hypothetical protein
VADGGGLENRYGVCASSWVRIPRPPLTCGYGCFLPGQACSPSIIFGRRATYVPLRLIMVAFGSCVMRSVGSASPVLFRMLTEQRSPSGRLNSAALGRAGPGSRWSSTPGLTDGTVRQPPYLHAVSPGPPMSVATI